MPYHIIIKKTNGYRLVVFLCGAFFAGTLMRGAYLWRSSDKRVLRPIYLVIFILFFMGMSFFIVYDALNLSKIPDDVPVTRLNTGWSVSLNGEELSVPGLSCYQTGKVAYGSTYTLTRTLDDVLYPDPCITVRVPQAIIHAYIDGEEFFSFNTEAADGLEEAADTTLFIPLKEEYAGKELTLTLTSTEGSTFYGLGPITYGPYQALMKLFITHRRVPIILGLFLLMLGVAQLIYVPILMDDEMHPDITLISGALATFDMGLFLLSSYEVFDLFIDNPRANTVIESVAFYFIPFLMSAYFSTLTSGKIKKLYLIFTLFDLILVCAAITLHVFDIFYITRLTIMFRVILAIEAVPYFYMLISHNVKTRVKYVDFLQKFSDRLIIIALALFGLCYIADCVMILFIRSFTGMDNPFGIPFTMIGCQIFAIMVQSHYFLHSVCNLRVEVVKHSLEERAFVDPLTGLSNRAACQQVLETIGREKIPYEIVSLDLDKLKQVNDTLGHTEGDRFLTAIADTLEEAFDGAALIGRMAGDEFIVILTGDEAGSAADRLRSMQELLEKKRAETDMDYLSFSAGSALNSETALGARAFDIYMLADRRMYENKQNKYNKMVSAT